MSETKNYKLYVTDDASENFMNVRKQIYGTTDSNMAKIDEILGQKANATDVVPTTRKVNNKQLNADITLSATDVGAAPSDHTHTKSEITDFPTSMPASDVSAWAKASTKPSYTASEVGAVPTTRKVNGKALSEDISLTAADVGAVYATKMMTAETAGYETLEAWLNSLQRDGYDAVCTNVYGFSDLPEQGWFGLYASLEMARRVIVWKEGVNKSFLYRDINGATGTWATDNWIKVYDEVNKPTSTDIGAATMTEVNTAINDAIGTVIGGSY